MVWGANFPTFQNKKVCRYSSRGCFRSAYRFFNLPKKLRRSSKGGLLSWFWMLLIVWWVHAVTMRKAVKALPISGWCYNACHEADINDTLQCIPFAMHATVTNMQATLIVLTNGLNEAGTTRNNIRGFNLSKQQEQQQEQEQQQQQRRRRLWW